MPSSLALRTRLLPGMLLPSLALLCAPPAFTQAASAIATQAPQVQQHIAQVTACISPTIVIKDDPTPCQNLKARMAELHVPGLSIVVIHNGVIEWAQGFGLADLSGKPVTPETLFQAGSISKPLAAMAALHLVQEKKLSLDTDVNQTLTSWKVPASDAAPGATVTLRELLTHTAGFTVHGFPGYAANEPVPTLIQVLNGEKPANTAPIRLESVPGSRWNYSGGGYTVMQQLVLDVVKEPFPKLLHDSVLAPIGMTHSTYQQPLPAEMRSNAATPYHADGTPVAGGAHTYPEMAAAGLWTTPTDLARYILENQHSLNGQNGNAAHHVLSTEMTKQMMTAGQGNYGLGLEIGGSAANPYFSHGGVNEGFESLFAGYEHKSEGAVIMTNAQGGSQIAEEIMGSIAKIYGWPDFQPIVHTRVTVDPAVLAQYVGKYEVSPGFTLSIALQKDHLVVQPPTPAVQMYPESPTRFFLTLFNVEFEFFKDEKGNVSYLILRQGGRDSKALKK